MSFPWYALIMENSQIFEVPLDSPIDYDSADMLSPANSPTLSLNRQQYQGSVLPNSLRYEHDGYFAGEHAHEFNHVAGGNIKDDTSLSYSVLKHQAYYAPVYHIDSDDVSFDYYPLTAVIQSSKEDNVLVAHHDGTFTFNDVTVNIDTLEVSAPHNVECVVTFDEALYTFDIKKVDYNKSIDYTGLVSLGKDVQLGSDTFDYTYSDGAHSWGKQFLYKDNKFTSADGYINNLNINVSTIEFDYSIILEVKESLQVVTDVSYTFIYDYSIVDTSLNSTYNAIVNNQDVTVTMPSWFSISLSEDIKKKRPTDEVVFGYAGIKPNPNTTKKMYVRLGFHKRGLEDFADILNNRIFPGGGYTLSSVSLPGLTGCEYVHIGISDPYQEYTASLSNAWVDNDDSVIFRTFEFTYQGMYVGLHSNLTREDITVIFKDSSNETVSVKYPFSMLAELHELEEIADYDLNVQDITNGLKFIHNADIYNELNYDFVLSEGAGYPAHSEYNIKPESLIIESSRPWQGPGITPEELQNIFNLIIDRFNALAAYHVHYSAPTGDTILLQESCKFEFKIKDQGYGVKNTLCIPWTSFYGPTKMIALMPNNPSSITEVIQAVDGKPVDKSSPMYCPSYTTTTAYDLFANFSGCLIGTSRTSSSYEVSKLDSMVGEGRLPYKTGHVNIDTETLFTAVDSVAQSEAAKQMYLLTYTHGGYLLISGRQNSHAQPLVICTNTKSDSNDKFVYDETVRFAALTNADVLSYTDVDLSLQRAINVMEININYYMSDYMRNAVEHRTDDNLLMTIFYHKELYTDIYNEIIKQDAFAGIYVHFNATDERRNIQALYYSNVNSWYLANKNNYASGSINGVYVGPQPDGVNIGYFALLYSASSTIRSLVDSDGVSNKIVDSNNNINIRDVGYTNDRMNKTATSEIAVSAVTYKYLGEGQYPDSSEKVPEYIKAGTFAKIFVNNSYYEFSQLDKDDYMYIKTIYKTDATYKVTDASVIADSDWQHGLNLDMQDSIVTINGNNINVRCKDPTLNYTVSIDSKTLEATFSGNSIFKEIDTGSYEITKKAAFDEHIVLNMAAGDGLISAIDSTYILDYAGNVITLNNNNKSFNVDALFGACVIDHAVFTDSNIQYHLSGFDTTEAIVTIEDIYNLKGITRGGINNGKISFDR